MTHRWLWLRRAAVVLAVGAASVFAWSTPALADDYSPKLAIPLPAEPDGESGAGCESAPADKNRWRFELDQEAIGDTSRFAELTVTFSPGGVQRLVTFEQNARTVDVFAEPGAALTAASAVVSHDAGTEHEPTFFLTQLCIADAPTSQTSSSQPVASSSQSGDGGGLPVTGVPLGGLTAIGLGLVTGGVALLYVRRRRDRSAA
jgi:LPXTG-motif cell wall-anchored protein